MNLGKGLISWMVGTFLGTVGGTLLFFPHSTLPAIIWIIGNLSACYILLGLTYETN